jgi:tRNA threonylcarbamoyladenosine biosynthesis protein TsaB
MGLILHIDTSLEVATLALSQEDRLLGAASNKLQNDHASWIHTAIEQLLKDANKEIQALDAVAVTIGPGSYTGLRVGLATAKGLCYALQKPLITIPTLELIASSLKVPAQALIVPMIDARRMEVFTATYSGSLQEIKAPYALVLNENSFSEELLQQEIFFCGNGATKFQSICKSSRAHFECSSATAAHMIPLGNIRFSEQIFADLAYSSPLYVKEFQSNQGSK